MPRKSSPSPIHVVYVTFPSSSTEYCYLCAFPASQGDEVMANGTRVRVVRTANYDPRATRYVYPLPDAKKLKAQARKKEIMSRLGEIARELREQDFLRGLARRSPEARKLWDELKQITKDL